MNRKIFGGSLLLTMIGAIILGGSLAWDSTQHTGINSATVGGIQWELAYFTCHDEQGEDNGASCIIGPSGETVRVGLGAIHNGGDFNLQLRQSDGQAYGEVVEITTSNEVTCDNANFSGAVTDASAETLDILQPGAHGGPFFVALTVDEAAPEACIGADVFYAVLITVETVGGDPGDVS